MSWGSSARKFPPVPRPGSRQRKRLQLLIPASPGCPVLVSVWAAGQPRSDTGAELILTSGGRWMKHVKGSIPSLVLMPCRQTDRQVHKGRGWRCKASAKIQNSVPISVPRPLFELMLFIYHLCLRMCFSTTYLVNPITPQQIIRSL